MLSSYIKVSGELPVYKINDNGPPNGLIFNIKLIWSFIGCVFHENTPRVINSGIPALRQNFVFDQ